MSSPLVQRLTHELGYPLLDESNFAAFVESQEHCVLFFTEDPRSFRESDDVAVILLELVGAFAGRFVPAVIARHDERSLGRRYGVRAWPALVFLRRGRYLGVITGVHDWTDFVAKAEEILAGEPSDPPQPRVPLPLARARQTTEGQRP